MTLLAVGLAGAAGALTRWWLARVVRATSEGFPWATFTINITGAFVLGLLTGAALYHGFRGAPRVALGTGFCGAYTTFSAWSLETVELAQEGRRPVAVANVVGSLLCGCAAAALGLALAGL